MPPDRVAGMLDALQHLQVGPEGPTLTRSGELTGPRGLLREVVTVAIDGAADTLGGSCSRLLRGTGSAAEVRAGVDELSSLLDLLESVDP